MNNSSRSIENICRICLKYQVNLNWNEEISELGGVSYKDCYYKYTKLEEKDPDFYPTSLCKKCSKELKNAHVLFEKALESFKILQEWGIKYFDMDIFNDGPPTTIKSEFQTSGVVNMDDRILLQTEEKPSLSTLCAIEKKSFSENVSNELNEIGLSEVASLDPIHFIDIHNFESSVEIPFDDHRSEALTSLRSEWTQRNNIENILPASLGRGKETADILSSNTTKARKRRICKVLSKDKLCKKIPEDCKNSDTKITKTESEDGMSLEELKTTAPKPKRLMKEKYLLMCSYCSLKVQGAKKLEIHEATHNENRERKEICPKCGLKFYNALCLRLHIKTHDVNRQKTHKCEFCEKAFFNKGALNVHRRVHLGLMIKCQICEKDFFRQVDLDKHLLKHSASPFAEKKYLVPCQYCNKSISTNKLKEHIAVHLNQPQMKCKICEKNFFCRSKCTSHLRRFHLKKLNEYEDFIHYYVDRNKRISTLMVKQKLVVKHFKQ